MLVDDLNETPTTRNPARSGALRMTKGHPTVVLARAVWERHTALALASVLLSAVAIAAVWTVVDPGPILGFAWWFKIPSHFFHFNFGRRGPIA